MNPEQGQSRTSSIVWLALLALASQRYLGQLGQVSPVRRESKSYDRKI
ncbi:hypothetical protein MF451_003779 [Salmonella enterica subsp. enterica serovar Saintpaul]|nr:hypothetical protein [Salmonella enterica subsp. enterica serovar Saintpaul]